MNTTVTNTPTDVHIAYAGGNPGSGTVVAIWLRDGTTYDSIIRSLDHSTANGGILEAIGEVLDHFNGKPVLIHTNLAYVTSNLRNLPRWSQGGWLITGNGQPLKNGRRWKRIYQHPGYPFAEFRLQPSDHPEISWAKDLAVEIQEKGTDHLKVEPVKADA